MTLVKGILPKFLQRRNYDVLMFGYVDAIHSNFPTITIHKALEMFAERYNLSHEEFNIDSAKMVFQRMNQEMRTNGSERKS